MKKHTRLSVILLIFTLAFAALIFTGCNKPKVGSPEYENPMGDTSAFKPAEEFEYLLDIDAARDRVAEIMESEEMPEDMSKLGPADLIAGLGEGFLEQKSVSAQASDKLVKVKGEYTLTDLGLNPEENPLEYLADVGAAEVSLPNHFQSERYMGHFFVANVDDIFETALVDLSEEDKGGLAMIGIAHPEDIYSWMGDELVMFTITNDEFDPESEVTVENAPTLSVLAIACDDADSAMDLITGMFQSPIMAMSGVQVNEKTIAGNDALIIPPPDIERNPFYSYMDEESKQQLKDQMGELEEMPSIAVVAVPGYLFLGDEKSIEGAIAAYDPEAGGTGRMAHIELESNWDLVLNNLTSKNMNAFMSMIDSEEISELISKLIARTRDLKELGATRLSAVVRDGENFEVELTTTRESIKLLEIVREIAAETDEATWEAIGEEIGSILAEQGGMGGGPMGGPMGGRENKAPF